MFVVTGLLLLCVGVWGAAPTPLANGQIAKGAINVGSCEYYSHHLPAASAEVSSAVFEMEQTSLIAPSTLWLQVYILRWGIPTRTNFTYFLNYNITGPNLNNQVVVPLGSTPVDLFSMVCASAAATSAINFEYTNALVQQVSVGTPASVTLNGVIMAAAFSLDSTGVAPDPLAYVTSSSNVAFNMRWYPFSVGTSRPYYVQYCATSLPKAPVLVGRATLGQTGVASITLSLTAQPTLTLSTTTATEVLFPSAGSYYQIEATLPANTNFVMAMVKNNATFNAVEVSAACSGASTEYTRLPGVAGVLIPVTGTSVFINFESNTLQGGVGFLAGGVSLTALTAAPQCEGGCGHGLCVSDNTCACARGFQGTACNEVNMAAVTLVQTSGLTATYQPQDTEWQRPLYVMVVPSGAIATVEFLATEPLRNGAVMLGTTGPNAWGSTVFNAELQLSPNTPSFMLCPPTTTTTWFLHVVSVNMVESPFPYAINVSTTPAPFRVIPAGTFIAATSTLNYLVCMPMPFPASPGQSFYKVVVEPCTMHAVCVRAFPGFDGQCGTFRTSAALIPNAAYSNVFIVEAGLMKQLDGGVSTQEETQPIFNFWVLGFDQIVGGVAGTVAASSSATVARAGVQTITLTLSNMTVLPSNSTNYLYSTTSSDVNMNTVCGLRRATALGHTTQFTSSVTMDLQATTYFGAAAIANGDFTSITSGVYGASYIPTGYPTLAPAAPGLSTGAIVGIVVGSVAGFGLLLFAIIFAVRRKGRKSGYGPIA